MTEVAIGAELLPIIRFRILAVITVLAHGIEKTSVWGRKSFHGGQTFPGVYEGEPMGM